MAQGGVELDDGMRLVEGDALRTIDEGAVSVTATSEAEILFWEMHTTFNRDL